MAAMAGKGYSSSDTSSDGSATPRKAFSYHHDYVVQHASDYHASAAATLNPLRAGLLQRDEEEPRHHHLLQRPDTPQKSSWHLPPPTILKYLLLSVLFLTAALGLLLAAAAANGPLQQQGKAKDTLVVYIFADTDPEYSRNMQHFIQHAVKEDDRCDYVFIIQVRLGWAPTHLASRGSGAGGGAGRAAALMLCSPARRGSHSPGPASRGHSSPPDDTAPPRSTTRRCPPTTCRCCRPTRATCFTRTPATTGAPQAGCSRAGRSADRRLAPAACRRPAYGAHRLPTAAQPGTLMLRLARLLCWWQCCQQ
jgi:hypothetical protein